MTATNKDLLAEVRAGRFREDLYYRLRVLEIDLPSLAQRAEDIPSLSAYMLGRLAPGRPLQLADDALRLLRRYTWPGNVRELRNALEHAVAVSTGNVILPQHLPAEIRHHAESAHAVADRMQQALAAWIRDRLAAGATYDEMLAQIETRLLGELLRQFDNKPTALARALDMNRATLLKKRNQFGLNG
jgi:DNA-binding NtrC family response regulator